MSASVGFFLLADAEFEIDKTLGITGPDDVAKMGIAAYNAECRKIVMRYSKEWEMVVGRLGRWIGQPHILFDCVSTDSVGFLKTLLGFTGFYLILPSYTGFYWVFAGFYLVLPNFTGFYLVLLGLTWFYWI